MRPARVFRTATFRLAALYVLLFAASVAVLGTTVYLVTAAALERRLDARIAGEMTTLKSVFQAGGLARLETEVRTHQRMRPAGPLDYLVIGAGGARLTGDLPVVPNRLGWSNVENKESDGDVSHRRVLVAAAVGRRAPRDRRRPRANRRA